MPSNSIEMGTKVKGLFRGLRYVSQIFDEQKEKEMQIGLPTDVKHVAHIGWDGPSTDSPSWMKGFDSPGEGHQSSPLNIGELGDNPEITWGSGDSKGGLQRASNSSAKDLADIPKPTRPQSLTDDDTGTSSPRKEKSRRSRRQHLKDSINSKLHSDGSGGLDSDHSDIKKKSRRKKSKESTSSRSSKSSRGRRSSSGSCSSSLAYDPESSVTSRISNKEEKESSETC